MKHAMNEERRPMGMREAVQRAMALVTDGGEQPLSVADTEWLDRWMKKEGFYTALEDKLEGYAGFLAWRELIRQVRAGNQAAIKLFYEKAERRAKGKPPRGQEPEPGRETLIVKVDYGAEETNEKNGAATPPTV